MATESVHGPLSLDVTYSLLSNCLTAFPKFTELSDCDLNLLLVDSQKAGDLNTIDEKNESTTALVLNNGDKDENNKQDTKVTEQTEQEECKANQSVDVIGSKVGTANYKISKPYVCHTLDLERNGDSEIGHNGLLTENSAASSATVTRQFNDDYLLKSTVNTGANPLELISVLQKELNSTRHSFYDSVQTNKGLVFHIKRMVDICARISHLLRDSIGKVKLLENKALELPKIASRLADLQRKIIHKRGALSRNKMSSPTPSSEGSLSPALRCVEAIPEDCESDCFDVSSEVTIVPVCKEDQEIANITRSLENFSIIVDDFITRRLQNQVNNLRDELETVKEERDDLERKFHCLDLDRDSLQSEFNNIETERMRLSILEEKLISITSCLCHFKHISLPFDVIGRLVIEALGEIHSHVIAEKEAMWFANSLQRRLQMGEQQYCQPARPAGGNSASGQTTPPVPPPPWPARQPNRLIQQILHSRKATCL